MQAGRSKAYRKFSGRPYVAMGRLCSMRRCFPRLLWSGLLFVILIAISLFLLPPASNVNCAHRPWPGLEPLIFHFVSLDPFSSARYILFITVATVFGNYLPANLVLGYAVSKCAVAAGYRPKTTG